MSDDTISRQAAIDALWKALYDYEDETEKQFQESDELDVGDWMQHRIFVQNMSDIDRQTILALPSAERKKGKWIAQKGGGYCCSECGSYSLDEVDGAFVHVSVRTRYCHNCGVKMEESDE